MTKVLLETGFLVSLNPRDRNRGWAVDLLKQAREGEVKIFISPASLVELSLILKSKGLPEEGISRALAAMESLIRRYTRPSFPELTFEIISGAAELRVKYSQLSFFDSIHAATALVNDLEYYDLDEVIKNIVKRERG